MKTRAFSIPKCLVVKAYRLVKANGGKGGIDGETLEKFEANLENNLYKIWNRLSSGSYFPPPVKAVAIPKKTGGERILGIPTISDRIAQMVIRQMFEPNVEPFFHEDSYGYRPNKSATEAIGVTRKRCWEYDWVLEFDIKGLFDNIDHTLLVKAVRKHTTNKYIIMYIERWLTAEMVMPDGTVKKRDRGTPQGGVISPILANLFMHYAYDKWLVVHHPHMKWCRYADDGLVHCRTLEEAETYKRILQERFKACGLEMHPVKTKIAYCKDEKRQGEYSNQSFDFLGYTFRPRTAKTKKGRLFLSFLPAVSKKALKAMKAKTRQKGFRKGTSLSLVDISRMYNAVLRGWYNYYGRYYPSALAPLWRHFNKTLVSWAMRKYKKLRSKTRAGRMLARIAEENSKLFIHWQKGIVGAFV